MRPILEIFPAHRLFGALPTPLLAITGLGLATALAVDLLVFDPLPFLDEALLGVLFYGWLSAVQERRRSRSSAPVSDGSQARGPVIDAEFSAVQPKPKHEILELPEIGVAVRELGEDAKELLVQVGALEAAGFASTVRRQLRWLPEAVEQQRDALVRADKWFTSRKHDPWQLSRELKAAREEHAAARSGGRPRLAEVAEAALADVEGRVEEARHKLADREQLLASMERSAAEIRTVRGWIRDLLDRDVAPSESVERDAALDPRLAAVGRALRDAWIAAREVDATAGVADMRAAPSRDARAREDAEAELRRLG